MNKDKWNKIVSEEIFTYETATIGTMDGPEDWAEEKQKILKLVESIDQATEIYNLENNIKG